MPFWSYRWAGGTWTYLAVSDLQTTVCLSASGGRLTVRASHDFRERDGFPPYEIEIWPGGNSPVSPGLEYRFTFRGLALAVRGVAEDVTDRKNPLFVNNNVDSPLFLTFGGTEHRVFTGRIRFIGRK